MWEHQSTALSCLMQFSIFLPPQARQPPVPFITFLSGLTCNHENFTTKSGAYQHAAKLGMAIIAPDTSPRGDDVPDDVDSYDFGKGAGFYLDAKQQPWQKHYRMETYITQELNDLVCNHFPLDKNAQGICGHSMGGHGALTLGLKHPELYKSLSAFSPIVAPSKVPWGQKAFSRYLGSDEFLWANHDACILVERHSRPNTPILIDQGTSDQFLDRELKSHLFADACHAVQQPLNLRLQDGYDHSYYFIQSFIHDHLIHHYNQLTNTAP